MPKQTFFNLTKEKQEQIIQAAIDVFSQFSFNEVKVSDIVTKAKIPRSSFYDYFEDKRDLFKYIILIIKEEKMKFITPAIEKHKGSFFESFKEYFRAGAKFAAMKPEYENLSRKMYENIELVNDILGVEDLDVSSYYEYMLEEGIKTGEIRSDIDVKFIAKSLYILSLNIMTEIIEEREGTLNDLIDELIDKILDFIKNGISN